MMLALVLAHGPAEGQAVFSPGPLSEAHAHLEGLTGCTVCHQAGKRLPPENCLSCHEQLRARVEKGLGFHGRMPEAERRCESCHHEHQGRSFPLFNWIPSRAQFPHEKTGWPLEGKHQSLKCETCHEQEDPEKETYLGLNATCASCHFDEHRGQLRADTCETCHTPRGWTPAPGFDHDKTGYPLTGKHRKVACDGCHERQQDLSTPADANPKPRSATFVAFAIGQQLACADCHEDPHEQRFGDRCESCHTTKGWNRIAKALREEREFHARTRFPLEGRHSDVPCRSCHGPWGKKPARFKDLAFERCTDCHVDAHVGQLSRPRKTPGCESCHSVAGFIPARFEVEDHQKTSWPLEGAHRAVGCTECHRPEPALLGRVSASVKRKLAAQQRPALFSTALFDVRGDKSRCDTCHGDPHADQFAKPCTACHTQTSFAELRFDHQEDTRFPLEGAHQKVECDACHRPARSGLVRYRPLATACAACHPDPHAGQFASGGRKTACESCHVPESFETLQFRHAPPFTEFALIGRHAQAACESCHRKVRLRSGAVVRQYKGLPQTCEGCHVDAHQGAFRGFVP